MESSLYTLRDDDQKSKIVISRDYNCIRPLQGLSFGEVLAFGYIEALTFSNYISGRSYLKTYIVQNTADPFPNLLKFIQDLGSEVKQFEDFFDSFPNEELVKDICKFGKLYFPDEDISGIFEFSRRFNAFVTYIDEDTDLTEAREFKFVHPYEVSIWKRDENYYLLYRVDSERNAVFVDPEPEILADWQRNVLNEFTVGAMNLFYTLPKSTELNSKIGAVAERVQKVDNDKKWDWCEQYKVYKF